jgi:hypothetical protein
MLPNFIVVGAAKSGTTSLYYYLKQHPEIYMSPIKEPLFFSFINKKVDFKGPFDREKNESIITEIEEYKALYKGVKNEKAIGECSPCYLYFQNSVTNIKKLIPECKIIIVLRNPIERAYSQYIQLVMLGQETLTFEKALKKQEERKKLNWRWNYFFVEQGFYYNQVKRYLDEFGLDKVSIYLFEELIEDPKHLMQNIYKFLSVDKSFIPKTKKIYNRSGLPKNRIIDQFLRETHFIKEITRPITSKKMREKIYEFFSNVNYNYKKKPEIKKETRKYLSNIYRNDCLRLQNLINRDLHDWLE